MIDHRPGTQTFIFSNLIFQYGSSLMKLFIIKGQKSHKSRNFFNVLVETSETWVTAVQRNHGYRPQIPSDSILCPLISRKLGFVKLVHSK